MEEKLSTFVVPTKLIGPAIIRQGSVTHIAIIALDAAFEAIGQN